MVMNSYAIFRGQYFTASLQRMISTNMIRELSTGGMLRKEKHSGYGNPEDLLCKEVKRMDDHSWKEKARDAMACHIFKDIVSFCP